jgi:MFS family permease
LRSGSSATSSRASASRPVSGSCRALLGVGGGVGVVLAGPIVDNLSYHYLFWLPLIPIALTTVATHFFVPESPVKVPGKVSWLAAALMSIGLVARSRRRE